VIVVPVRGGPGEIAAEIIARLGLTAYV